MENKPKLVKGEKSISEAEAEARLSREGFDSIRWHDVAGTTYPRHRHAMDECIFMLTGSISFIIDGETYELQPGDRLYLPARTPHEAIVPHAHSATYLVGQRVDSHQ